MDRWEIINSSNNINISGNQMEKSMLEILLILQKHLIKLIIDWIDPLVIFQHLTIQFLTTSITDNVQSVFNDFNPAHVSLLSSEQIDLSLIILYWG